MKTKKKSVEEPDGDVETDKENEKEWHDEENLGEGWKKKSVARKGSKHLDHYYRSPEGEVYKSMAKAKKVIGEGKKENDETPPVKIIEKRQSCPTPLSPKYVEAFENFLENKSKSSRKEEKEKALEKEKMCNLKRKLDNELRAMEKTKDEEQKALNDKEKETQRKDKKEAQKVNESTKEAQKVNESTKEAPKVIESKKEVLKANEKKSIFEKAKKKETNDSTKESKENLVKNEEKSLTENAKQIKNVKDDNKSTAKKNKSIFEKAKRKKCNDSDLDSEPEEEPSKRKKVESGKEKKTEENVTQSSQNKLTVKKANQKQNKKSDLDTETESEESEEEYKPNKVKSKKLAKKKSVDKVSSGKKSKEKRSKKSDLDTESESEEEVEPKKNKKKNSPKKNSDKKQPLKKKASAIKDKNEDLEKQSESESEEEVEPKKNKKKNSPKENSDKKQPKEKIESAIKDENEDLEKQSESESEEEVEPKKNKKTPKENSDKKQPKEKKESAIKDKNEDLEKHSESESEEEVEPKKNKKKNSEGKSGKNTPKTTRKKNRVVEGDESDEDTKKNQPDKEKEDSKPEKTNKKTKRKSDYDFASESESEEEIEEQKKLMAELRQFFKDNNIQLKPRSPTRGDGNCFFRSVADQILLHKIADQPTTHRDLRLAVCNHIKDLPKDVLQSTVDIIYKGKRRGLADLAHRQRKLGQFVDDYGIMVMSTALFLGRNIEVYSAHASGNQGHSVTNIDGGEGADQHSPLTIFYFKDYQHYQGVGPTGKANK